MRFRVRRSSRLCVVDEVVRNITLERKTHVTVIVKPILQYLYRLYCVFFFYFVRQKIAASSHCKILWHIPSQERGNHKSDPGHGKVQRKLKESDLRSPRSNSIKNQESCRL